MFFQFAIDIEDLKIWVATYTDIPSFNQSGKFGFNVLV